MKSKNKIWKNTSESQLSWTKLRRGNSCPNALLSIWYKINQYPENPECRAVCLFVDCKTSVFSSKSVKKIGKAWSKSLTREAREPHTPHRRVRREKNRQSVFHNEIVPTRGFKIARVSGLSGEKGKNGSEKGREVSPSPVGRPNTQARFKNVVELSKICSQLHPLCVFDTLGD